MVGWGRIKTKLQIYYARILFQGLHVSTHTIQKKGIKNKTEINLVF